MNIFKIPASLKKYAFIYHPYGFLVLYKLGNQLSDLALDPQLCGCTINRECDNQGKQNVVWDVIVFDTASSAV